jgi:hypothetical protein
MSPPRKKSPPRKRNLAARALRSPLFRPKIAANPNAYRRRKRFIRNPVDEGKYDQIN